MWALVATPVSLDGIVLKSQGVSFPHTLQLRRKEYASGSVDIILAAVAPPQADVAFLWSNVPPPGSFFLTGGFHGLGRSCPPQAQTGM